MNPTLSYLLGRKMWWVSGINVWGTTASLAPYFVITETEGSSKRIVHTGVAIGGSAQLLEYKDLTDIKGNALPEELTNPRVVALPKGSGGVVVQGSEGTKSFALARTEPNSQIATVDLLIIEMG